MTAKPIVDGLSRQYANRVRIVRADLLTPAGRDLADRYQFNFTPYFVGFDARGNVAWTLRGRVPTPDMLDLLLAP